MSSSEVSASRRWPVSVRALVVGVAAIVFMFLAWRSSPWFSELRWMPRAFARWADHHGIARNVVGFFGFGLVGFAFIGRGWLPVISAALFAAALEIAQLWIPGRIFDRMDIYASWLGLALAWIVLVVGAWLRRRLTSVA